MAVLLVILDHLMGWPAGGFIGVDVFFVISGFLITRLLVKETDRRGRISFRGFYARRARRILPAALTVLLAVTIASRLVYPGTARVEETQTDVLWALGFGANLHFSRIGADYFQADRAPSLVQHFWSLAVEEQFYVIWPVVVLIFLTLLGRWLSPRKARLVLLAVVAAAAASSFALGAQQTATTPVTAYFSAPVRAWELAVGAFVAVAESSFPGFFQRLGRAAGPLSLVGVIGVLSAAFVLSPSSSFPVPGAALPVVAAAVVIVAGIGAPPLRWAVALTNPVSRYVGRISYSLYLVHWPVIVLVASLIPSASWLRYPISVLGMLGLSVASYHFVEAPFRGVAISRGSVRMPTRRRVVRISKQAFGSVALVALALALCLFVPARPAPTFGLPVGPVASLPLPARVAGSKAVPTSLVAQPSQRLAEGIDSALARTTFPRLNPPLDQLTIKSAHVHWGGCQAAVDLASCSFGHGEGAHSRVAVVIGDSFAMAWMPTIEAALPAQDWKIYGFELAQCPAAYVSVFQRQRAPVPYLACDRWHQFAIDKANSLKPDLVILSSSSDSAMRLSSKATGAAAIDQYQAGLTKTITRLMPSSRRRVLTLTAPPTGVSLQSCVNAQSVPAQCVSTVSPHWRAVAGSEKKAAAATRTSFLDTHLWFCSRNDYCPAFVGTTPMRWDTGHLTPDYAKMLGPELAAAVGPHP